MQSALAGRDLEWSGWNGPGGGSQTYRLVDGATQTTDLADFDQYMFRALHLSLMSGDVKVFWSDTHLLGEPRPVTFEFEKRCECGADASGGGMHSHYCPKAT